MTKGFKILLGIGIFLVICIIIFFVSGITDNPQSGNKQDQNQIQKSQTNQQNQIPEYILPTEEEKRVKEFAFSFIKLYNTYGYSDFSNLLALGDYETPLMQEKSLALAKELEVSVSEGFMQEAENDLNYFFYKYPDGSKLEVNVRVAIKQYSNYYQKPELDFSKSFIPKLENNQNKEFKIELSKYGKTWLVNRVEALN